MKREEFIEWINSVGFKCRSLINDNNWRNLTIEEIYHFHNLRVNENNVKFSFDKFSFGIFDEVISKEYSFEEFIERFTNLTLKD